MNGEKLGVLLVNTGSPDAPHTKETRVYLRQFLSDPRVIDIAPLARWLLLNFVILPFRPKHSAHAYRQVWTDAGSPLIVNSQKCRDALQEQLGDANIEIAMAYGSPSLNQAIDALLDQGTDRIVVVPMFPQYASATYGSVMEGVYKNLSERINVPPVSVVAPFYRDPGFLDAWAAAVKGPLDDFGPDQILVSFHGLPERQIRKADATGTHCLVTDDCCDRYLDGNPQCYRAHCFETTKGIFERLNISEEKYTLAFQSKLGRDPWLTPAADQEIIRLAQEGVKRLAVLSPAFVADCLETLEEIGLRSKEDFLANGGEEFLLVPSLNDHPQWVGALANLVRGTTGSVPSRISSP